MLCIHIYIHVVCALFGNKLITITINNRVLKMYGSEFIAESFFKNVPICLGIEFGDLSTEEGDYLLRVGAHSAALSETRLQNYGHQYCGC